MLGIFNTSKIKTYCLSILLLTITSTSVNACQKALFILRHAEEGSCSGPNCLNPSGQSHAEHEAEMLKNFIIFRNNDDFCPIKKVYAYNRWAVEHTASLIAQAGNWEYHTRVNGEPIKLIDIRDGGGRIVDYDEIPWTSAQRDALMAGNNSVVIVANRQVAIGYDGNTKKGPQIKHQLVPRFFYHYDPSGHLKHSTDTMQNQQIQRNDLIVMLNYLEDKKKFAKAKIYYQFMKTEKNGDGYNYFLPVHEGTNPTKMRADDRVTAPIRVCPGKQYTEECMNGSYDHETHNGQSNTCDAVATLIFDGVRDGFMHFNIEPKGVGFKVYDWNKSKVIKGDRIQGDDNNHIKINFAFNEYYYIGNNLRQVSFQTETYCDNGRSHSEKTTTVTCQLDVYGNGSCSNT